MNKSLLIMGLLVMAAASAPVFFQYQQASSGNSGLLLAQRSCNPNDPSYCP